MFGFSNYRVSFAVVLPQPFCSCLKTVSHRDAVQIFKLNDAVEPEVPFDV